MKLAPGGLRISDTARSQQARSGPARSILALILREMSTSYGRSPGGYIWVVLEQLGVLLMFSLAFSMFLKVPGLGNSFLLFYATGFLPFKMFQEVSTKTALALRFSKPLLAYPAITYMDAILARLILTVLTQLMVSYIIFAAILMVQDTHVVLNVGPILAGMAAAGLLGLAVGVLNAVLFEFVPVWRTIFSVATRPLLIASGVIFLMEDLPSRVQDILWFNPLIHIIALTRTGFFPFYSPNYISLIYVFLLSLLMLLFGLILLRRFHRTILTL